MDRSGQEVEIERRQNALLNAAMHGDWGKAIDVFEQDAEARTAKLNSMHMTALHVAAKCGKSQFVKYMVLILRPDELAIQDQLGRTALHYVASSASVRTARLMVSKHPFLTQVEESFGYTPLYYAARWRHPSKAKEMVEYLYGETPREVYSTDPDHFFKTSNLITAITASGCHGIALDVIRRSPELALVLDETGWSILQILAADQPSTLMLRDDANPFLLKRLICQRRRTRTMAAEAQQEAIDDKEDLARFVCKKLQEKRTSDIMDYFLKPTQPGILQTATKHGHVELVKLCLEFFPDLIWYSSPNDQQFLLHVAVEYRQKDIFNHIISLVGDNIETYSEAKADKDGNNILHLAAKLAPLRQLHSIPGPAFQMQQELQWFTAVEDLVYKNEKVDKNSKGLTPKELFFEEHKDLIKDAKEWMRETSNSCMVIAALVATVAFASMITVPGGNNTEGLPVLHRRPEFIVFSVSNALSMMASAIALLVFLSIQTSRYTEKDFMNSLPNNLLSGLFALFVAVATMMIAFALAIGLSLRTRVAWAYIPITLAACIPAVIFTWLQFPLLVQTLVYTSGPGTFAGSKRDLKKWFLKLLADCGLVRN